MIPGTKFNAIHKDTGNAVTVNGDLAEFTATKLVEEDGIEWQECVIKGRPLTLNKKERPHQLFTRLFDFYEVKE